MKFYFSVIDKGMVEIHVSMESDSGDSAESIQELHPGEEFMGVPFEKFIEDGTGEMEI